MKDGSPMPAIVWNSIMQTGITSIDAQHKTLVENVNNLFDSVQQGKGDKATEPIILFLERYTLEHFKMEEELMAKSGYPGFAAHKKQHQDLIRKVKNLRYQQRDRTNPTLWRELSAFLSDWWREHIMRADMNYVPYLKGR